MLTNRKQNLKTVSSWIPEQFYTYQPLQQLSAQPAEVGEYNWYTDVQPETTTCHRLSILVNSYNSST